MRPPPFPLAPFPPPTPVFAARCAGRPGADHDGRHEYVAERHAGPHRRPERQLHCGVCVKEAGAKRLRVPTLALL
eukprot:76282-Chlamydomonas_euryale.AAC.3